MNVASGSDWLPAREAAARLGVSRSTLHAWTEAGWITTYRLGGVTRYSASDGADLIASNRRPRRVTQLSPRQAQATAAQVEAALASLRGG